MKLRMTQRRKQGMADKASQTFAVSQCSKSLFLSTDPHTVPEDSGLWIQICFVPWDQRLSPSFPPGGLKHAVSACFCKAPLGKNMEEHKDITKQIYSPNISKTASM